MIGQVTIGRKVAGAVDIGCPGKTVSRHHCVLTFTDDVWHVEDLRVNSVSFCLTLKLNVCFVEHEWCLYQWQEDSGGNPT